MPEPFRTDDELVSAVLDGEATAEERARLLALLHQPPGN